MKHITLRFSLPEESFYIQYYYPYIYITPIWANIQLTYLYTNDLNCSLIIIKKTPTLNQLKSIFQGNKNKAKQTKHLNSWLILVALKEK